MWVHVEDSVSCARGDQTLCCTHSEAALMASWNRSQEMCAQQIGAFGTQLVLKAFFFFPAGSLDLLSCGLEQLPIR